ncbi:MAG: ribbon-helix-helix protein, CopG family [Burkholderiales bacterium]
MTFGIPPLSVRLDPALAAALERYCIRTGQTRSRVVQQVLAQYLAGQSGPTLGDLAETVLPPAPARAAHPGPDSPRERFRQKLREKRRR